MQLQLSHRAVALASRSLREHEGETAETNLHTDTEGHSSFKLLRSGPIAGASVAWHLSAFFGSLYLLCR